MPDNDAEEITIVLKDGTVYRYTGEAASDLWSGIRRAEGEYLDLSMSLPTTTKSKPLRKVTTLEGSFKIGPGECEQLLVHADGETPMAFYWLDTLLPREVVEAGRKRHHRVRITVDAVPVEEKD